MSVEVKTPTKTQFEHTEFQCGDKKRGHSVSVMTAGSAPTAATVGAARTIFNRQTSENIGVRYGRKRRYSERAGGDGSRERYLGAPGTKRRFSRSGRGPYPEKIVLPTKFLLGGNINDPLNLNSLSDETINKALNENTPKSSPLAVPYHRQHVHVIIPPNIEDPLGLDTDGDPALLSPKSMGKNRKKRNNKHKKSRQDRSDASNIFINDISEVTNASNLCENKDFTTPVHIEIFSDSELPSSTANNITPGDTSTPIIPPSSLKLDNSSGYPPDKVVDHIVSPVIPQLTSPKSRRLRKRTNSEGKGDGVLPSRLSLWDDGEKGPKQDKTSPHRPKFKRQHSHSSSNQSQPTTPVVRSKPRNHSGRRHKEKVFIYGNYNQYYGYRNPGGSDKDNRLKNFNLEWFDGKDVLDIGCNAGHVTLEIAKNLHPRKITGIDIDSTLIGAAKKNVRHYLSTQVARKEKFPSSLVASFGPIAAPPVKTNEANTEFPNNVSFLTGNYVLESDELVDMAREEYDVILALSVTKWMHLNWGDAGLKRTFRRMFKQLRPGGKLILEPQLWPSYKRRKKLTEAHLLNFTQIQLRPEQFREYLLREVGFSKSETLEVPYNKAKGFQRPLLIFTKSSTTQPCSRVTTPGRSDTSRGATPRFQVGWSGTATPNTCDSCDSSTVYTFSPASMNKDTPKRDPVPMDTIPERTLVNNIPATADAPKAAPRNFAELRSNSAPAILQGRREGSSNSLTSYSMESNTVTIASTAPPPPGNDSTPCAQATSTVTAATVTDSTALTATDSTSLTVTDSTSLTATDSTSLTATDSTVTDSTALTVTDSTAVRGEHDATSPVGEATAAAQVSEGADSRVVAGQEQEKVECNGCDETVAGDTDSNKDTGGGHVLNVQTDEGTTGAELMNESTTEATRATTGEQGGQGSTERGQGSTEGGQGSTEGGQGSTEDGPEAGPSIRTNSTQSTQGAEEGESVVRPQPETEASTPEKPQ